MEDFAKTYVPLISAVISLVSVIVAFLSLHYTQQDRIKQQEKAEQERISQQRVAEADALRREQEALFAALQGEKEAVAFMALQLSQNPKLITESNQDRLFTALCLAFVYESSSRTRALVLKTLQQSMQAGRHDVIEKILNEIKTDFLAYDKDRPKKELTEYIERIDWLKLQIK